MRPCIFWFIFYRPVYYHVIWNHFTFWLCFYKEARISPSYYYYSISKMRSSNPIIFHFCVIDMRKIFWVLCWNALARRSRSSPYYIQLCLFQFLRNELKFYPIQAKNSKNIIFSLWGKQCGFPKLHFFHILAHCHGWAENSLPYSFFMDFSIIVLNWLE